MFAVESNCKIFAFQGYYLSTFGKKQYRNTLKINPQNFQTKLSNKKENCVKICKYQFCL